MSSSAKAFESVADTLGEGSAAPCAPLPRRSEPVGTREIAGALSRAQADIRGAQKDAVNPGFRSRYATLSAVWDACRAPLSVNGLAVAQMPCMVDGKLMLETRMMHTSGESLSSWWPISPVKNDPQGLGSALTYARRYSLAAMVGVAPDDDDDGQAASQPAQPAPSARVSPASELQRVLGMISGAATREALAATAEEITGLASSLAPPELAIAQKAYKARVTGFESKDRTAAQRAEIRAGMRKGE